MISRNSLWNPPLEFCLDPTCISIFSLYKNLWQMHIGVWLNNNHRIRNTPCLVSYTMQKLSREIITVAVNARKALLTDMVPFRTPGSHNRCVRLASLGHSGEPLTRVNLPITRPHVVTSRTLGQPQVTHSTSRRFWPGWAPGMTSKLFERTGGQTGSIRRSLPNAPGCPSWAIRALLKTRW